MGTKLALIIPLFRLVLGLAACGVSILLLATPRQSFAQSSGKYLGFMGHVTTQQWQDGSVDKGRYFIFSITHLPKSNQTDGLCEVVSITVNNADCKKESFGSGRGVFLKAESSSELSCRVVQRAGGNGELTVTETNPFMTFTHLVKFVSEGRTRTTIVDYRGTLVKSSALTQSIETAEYRPLKASSVISGGWEDIKLACDRLSVPMIPKRIEDNKK